MSEGTETAATTQIPSIDEQTGDPRDVGWSNEHVEKSKETALNYWAFVKDILKSPSKRELNDHQHHFVFGYISIVLVSLFYGLGFYFYWKESLGFGGETAFLKTFFESFLSVGLEALFSVVSIFLVTRFLFKAPSLTFHHILGRYGALITIPVVCSIAFFLLAMIGMTSLSGILRSLTSLLLLIVTVITLLSYKDKAKAAFDPIYAVALIVLANVIYTRVQSELLFGDFLGGTFGNLLSF
ncbi:DUF6574 domain-containing protein [Shouchella lonarensis]|nr:DUF6574 domain-containing protein [Shouchella lonarensis]